MDDLSKYRLNIATERLISAKLLLDAGQYKDSIGRSYYAIFSGVRAILAIDEVDFSKHAGVIAYFQREYVKTGIFDKKYSKYLQQAFQIRNSCDYDDFFIVSKQDAIMQYDNAEELLETIRKYVDKIHKEKEWRSIPMKYVVIGAGGTGGAIGGFLARAGKDVTLIARGAHLTQIQKNGLHFETVEGEFTVTVPACTMEEYQGIPDIIFVCVKGYSLEDAVPFIERIAGAHTIVIPILNIYGTGGKLQEKLPHIHVTDGCIYIAAEIKAPGTILMSGTIFRVVYGLRKGTPDNVKTAVMPTLEAVSKDLEEAGIVPLLSEQIEKDALQKFSFVSPMAAIGAGYDVTAGAVQAPGKLQDTFIAMVKEIKALSDAIDASLPEDIVEINMNIMNGLVPTATASMHRDIRDGKQSELDGLVFEVVRMGEKYGVEVPVYKRIAEMFQDK